MLNILCLQKKKKKKNKQTNKQYTTLLETNANVRQTILANLWAVSHDSGMRFIPERLSLRNEVRTAFTCEFDWLSLLVPNTEVKQIKDGVHNVENIGAA